MRVSLLLALLLLLPAGSAGAGGGEVALLTDDAIPRYLARGRDLARAKQWDKMVDILQRVVIGDPEVFPDLRPDVLNAAVYSVDDKIFYSARELCLQELARMPPDGLRSYRAAFDSKARALLTDAKRQTALERRISALALVYDRYLVSSVGDDALEMSADLNLALGRYYEALSLLRRLVEVYPDDTDRDVALALTKAAYCAARIGAETQRDRLLRRLASDHGNARVTVEGKSVPARELADHPALTMQAGAEDRAGRPGEWPMAGGNAARNRVGEDLPESLPSRPFWVHKLRERDPRLVAVPYVWRVVEHDRERTGLPVDGSQAYPAVRPVASGGRVYYKDYNKLLMRRLGSGTFVPHREPGVETRFTTDPAFISSLNPARPDSGTGKGKQYEAVYRYVDYGGNSVVLAGERVLATESDPKHPPRHLVSSPQRRPVPHRNVFLAESPSRPRGFWGWDGNLCSYPLKIDPVSEEAWQADYQSHFNVHFMGPGAASEGLAYTVVMNTDHEGDVSLWCFDIEDGRVRFRTHLHAYDATTRTGDAPQLPTGAGVAVAGGVAYVSSGAGVVAAVDALPPGRIRWIRRYERAFLAAAGPAGKIDQTFSFNEPLVVAGKVIVAAPDAMKLLALDAESGRIAWSRSWGELGRPSHVVGVHEGLLVLAGDKVCALNVADGKAVWGDPPISLPGFAFGRGYVGRKYAYIPTRNLKTPPAQVQRFDLKTGRADRPLSFDVLRLGNLLCVEGRLIVVNESEILCFTSLNHELGLLDRKIEAGESDPAELLLERGLVALSNKPTPLRDSARADFRKSLALAEAAGNRCDHIRARALDNLFALALEKRDLEPLEEAESITERITGPAALRSPGPYSAQIAYLRAVVLGRLGRADEAVEAIEALLDEHADQSVRSPSNRIVAVTPAVVELRRELVRENAAFQTAFVRNLRARIDAAVAARDKETLARLPRRYGGLPPAEECYFALARLQAEDGQLEEADLSLRLVIHEFKAPGPRAHAHLLLARLLARQGHFPESMVQRGRGLALLREEGRLEHQTLIEELTALLPLPTPAARAPLIKLPLARGALTPGQATPVVVDGAPPAGLEGLILLADENHYYAVDGAGALLWTRTNPAGGDASSGPESDPATAPVSAAIATARFARFVDGDLVIGDVFGVSRIDAKSGAVRWQRPETRARAAARAQDAIERLREESRLVDTEVNRPRRTPLPLFALSGQMLVRLWQGHTPCGFHIGNGEANPLGKIAADDMSAPVGAPHVMGQLVAFGWSEPARVHVYGIHTGARIMEYAPENAVLLAPPVLDPYGRICVIRGSDRQASSAKLEILDIGTARPIPNRSYDVHSNRAMVLAADGRQVVFHNGKSGPHNLQFASMADGRVVTTSTGDLLRDVYPLFDGQRMFVFTCSQGVGSEGARLFRIDLKARQALRYETPPAAHSYARPVLTERFVVVASGGEREANLRLYDREGSADSRAPSMVFAGDAGIGAEFVIRSPLESDYRVAVGVTVTGSGLAIGSAFGSARLAAAPR